MIVCLSSIGNELFKNVFKLDNILIFFFLHILGTMYGVNSARVSDILVLFYN